VRKAVKSGTAAAVVAAVDIQHTNPCARLATQPGAEIAEICALAAAHNIPVVFALTRVGLGSIFGANKRMSAVALTNVAGMEAPLARVLQLAAQARARYALLARASATQLF
jgi:ribosomal protein L7Ae-like RNA K-turn-binding protein